MTKNQCEIDMKVIIKSRTPHSTNLGWLNSSVFVGDFKVATIINRWDGDPSSSVRVEYLDEGEKCTVYIHPDDLIYYEVKTVEIKPVLFDDNNLVI